MKINKLTGFSTDTGPTNGQGNTGWNNFLCGVKVLCWKTGFRILSLFLTQQWVIENCLNGQCHRMTIYFNLICHKIFAFNYSTGLTGHPMYIIYFSFRQAIHLN